MSNENLQKLTAALLLSKVQSGFSLDQARYLQGPVLQNIILLADLRIKAKKMMEILCKEWPYNCYLKQVNLEEIIKISSNLSEKTQVKIDFRVNKLKQLSSGEQLDNQIPNESWNRTNEEIKRDLQFSRQMFELSRNIRRQYFLEDANKEDWVNLTFSLSQEQTNMSRLAVLAKKYNAHPQAANLESQALKDFVNGLHEMGVLGHE